MIKVHLLSILMLFLALVVSVYAINQVVNTRQNASEPEVSEAIHNNNLVIAGYVYLDKNKNSMRDLSEPAYRNVAVEVLHTRTRPRNTPTSEPTISLDPTPIASVSPSMPDTSPYPTGDTINPLPVFLKTDKWGYFKYVLPSEEVKEKNFFTITLRTRPEAFVTTLNPVTFSNLYSRVKKTVEFGVYLPDEFICTPRPDCLDATPACRLPEPEGGWCDLTPTPEPTETACNNPVKRNTYIKHISNGKCRAIQEGKCIPQGWRQVNACPTPTIIPPTFIPSASPQP